MEATPQTAFFDACRRNDVQQLQALYNSDSSLVNIQDVKSFTPLIIAVYNGSMDAADFLLQHHASLDMQDAAGNTALMGVCLKGYKALAERLIAAGSNVNQPNFQGATALTYAATFGHLEIAKLLIENGAELMVRDSRGKAPIDHAVLQENEPMVVLLEGYLHNK